MLYMLYSDLVYFVYPAFYICAWLAVYAASSDAIKFPLVCVQKFENVLVGEMKLFSDCFIMVSAIESRVLPLQ